MSITISKCHLTNDELLYLQQSIIEFNRKHCSTIRSHFRHGTILNKSFGYYIVCKESNHREKPVKSWENFETITEGDLSIDIISMNYSDAMQYIHIASDFGFFSKRFYEIIDKIESHNSAISKGTIFFTFQEIGQNIRFHTDSGVHNRLHINLCPQNNLDFFYIGDKTHQIEFGNQYTINTSAYSHSYMCFNKFPRIHLIGDINC